MVALSAVTAVAAGVLTAFTSAGVAQGQSDLAFGACPAPINGAYPNIRCAELTVPIDYSNPTTGNVTVQVSRLAAADPAKRRGVLVVNPGGPGAPGLTYGPGSWAARLPASVRDSYDIIGFDPRGAGRSTPMRCLAEGDEFWGPPMPDPDPAANRRLNFDRSAQYAQACHTNARAKLTPHLTTRNVARDIDTLRTRLGVPKISFVGYSYGTYLGATYASLYPARVDRMVLDSNVNPTPPDFAYRWTLSQAAAAGPALSHYFGWIASHDDVFGLGSSAAAVRARWDGALATLRAQPRGALGAYEFLDMSFNNLYNENDWVGFGHALADFAVRADDAGLQARTFDRRTPGTGFETQYSVYSAVTCNDAPWPRRENTVVADAEALQSQTPFAWYVQFFSVCYTWPTPAQPHLTVRGDNLPPILMFNSTGDIATPYAGALALHQALPSSVLVTEAGSYRHGVAYQPAAPNQAANQLATDYLVSGLVPSADTTIPAHPLPDARTAASPGR
nr:alpha/beta hydrolase [Kibdelosporangium phytohabitans]